MTQMEYLTLGIAIAWGTYFVYLFALDSKLRQLKRRLDTRDESA
jgi:CcmD family protein